jgi:AhpD family alkylhydroperoxidase
MTDTVATPVPAVASTALVDPLTQYAPSMDEAYRAFGKAVFAPEAAVPLKYRELAAIAVALTTQCETCLKGHTAAAVKAGATDEEIAEISFVAAALRAGGAVVHGRKAMQAAARAHATH